MGEICYQVKEIPDLTLNKYSFLSQSGVGGVLELHSAFLRQWHEKSILSGVSMHLVYEYKSHEKPGQKIQIYFIVEGKDSALENVDIILQGSSLSDYFNFEFLYRTNGSSNEKNIDVLTEYDYCSVLTKEEIFFNGSDGKTYYDVPLWEPNDDGRLYDMFRMMDSLNEDIVFRVDLKATKKNRSLRKSLSSGPIPRLHELQSSKGGERDYGADSILHDYDALMKALDSSPHFSADIFVFSKNRENGAMVMAAAVSEAVEKGDYNISSFKGSFRIDSFISNDNSEFKLLDTNDQVNEFYLEYKQGRIRAYSYSFESLNMNALAYLTNTYTLDEISPMFRFPCLFDGETINIRKETVAPLVSGENSLYLGLDENGYEINFPIKLLPKHAFISGVPGSGKTNTMHHLTHTLWAKHRIPFLVLEPAKKEYRALCNMDDMSELRLFSPRSNMIFPLHINPFEFPKGMSVAEHIRTLCGVFEGAFPLDNPMPFLLDTAIEGVYRDMGWLPETVYTDETKLKFPTMSMLYKRLEEELEKTTYSSEVRGNLESALKVRIGSLLRREMGDVFDVEKSSLTPEEWIEKPTVVELEAMGSGPSNFLTLMLCSLIRECLKVNPIYNDGPTRHVIFIEEAHNLIGPDSEEKTGEGANAKVAATAFVVKMLAEVRALKESVFIADQLPTVMAPEVIKNTGLKIALRLTAMDDRQLLCNSMSANSSQIEDMGNFKVGEALISYEGLQRPFKMRINEWCGKYDKGIKEEMVTPKNDAELFDLLKDSDVYKENIRRSLISTFKKFFFECELHVKSFNDIINLLNEDIRLIDRVNEIEKMISHNYNDALLIVKQYDNNSQVAAQENDEYKKLMKKIFELQKLHDNLSGLLQNIDAHISQTNSCILKLIDFSTKVERKRSHYKNLGIEITEEDIQRIKNNDGDISSDKEKWKMAFYYMKTSIIERMFSMIYRLYSAEIVLKRNDDNLKNKIIEVCNILNLNDKYEIK